MMKMHRWLHRSLHAAHQVSRIQIGALQRLFGTFSARPAVAFLNDVPAAIGGSAAATPGTCILRHAAIAAIVAGNLLAAGTAGAADVTATGSQPIGAQWNLGSWTGGSWPGGVPSIGNTYRTGAFVIRTPESGSSTFGGASLRVVTGGTLLLKADPANANLATANLILDGGSLNSGTGGTGGGVQAISGNLEVASNSLVNLTDANRRRISMANGTFSGSGGLTISGKDANDLFQLEATVTSTHTGNWTINGGRVAVFLDSQIYDLASVTLGGSAATLDIQSVQTIGSLSGTAGNVFLNANALTVGENDASTGFGGIISGTGGALTKTGNGILTLSNANTYTGGTTVNAGTLLANNASGSATGTGGVIVNGGTFGGSGSISGAVTVNDGGTLSPGTSIESLATGSNIWNTGGALAFEFSTDGGTGSAGAQWDLLAITGNLDLSGADTESFTIDLITMANATTPGSLATWDPNTDHTWAGFVTTTTGFVDFDPAKFTFNVDAFLNELNGSFSVVQNGNNLDLVYAAVPEPGTVGLILVGGGMLWMFRRKRLTCER